jgi:hypothetical protein
VISTLSEEGTASVPDESLKVMLSPLNDLADRFALRPERAPDLLALLGLKMLDDVADRFALRPECSPDLLALLGQPALASSLDREARCLAELVEPTPELFTTCSGALETCAPDLISHRHTLLGAKLRASG